MEIGSRRARSRLLRAALIPTAHAKILFMLASKKSMPMCTLPSAPQRTTSRIAATVGVVGYDDVVAVPSHPARYVQQQFRNEHEC